MIETLFKTPLRIGSQLEPVGHWLILDGNGAVVGGISPKSLATALVDAVNSGAALRAENERLREVLEKALGRLEQAVEFDPPSDWHCVGLAADDIRAALGESNG